MAITLWAEFPALRASASGSPTDMAGMPSEVCRALAVESPIRIPVKLPGPAETAMITKAVELAISLPAEWAAPKEYLAENVSHTVAKIVLGYHSSKKHF